MYFFNTLGYEVAIFLFLKLLNLEFSGAAIDSLHSENPRSRDFIIFFFLDNVFSIKTFYTFGGLNIAPSTFLKPKKIPKKFFNHVFYTPPCLQCSGS